MPLAHVTGKRCAVCREGGTIILHVRLGIVLLLIVGAVAPMRAQDGPVDRGVRTRALAAGWGATLFAYYRPKPAVSAGLVGLGARYHLRRGGRLLPFLSGGAGFLWTSLDVPEIDRIFNGQLYYGAGIRVRSDRNPSWRIEIRNHHISNAGTSGENLGLNAFVLIAASIIAG
jgi:lipid A 3-O-deacylase PagL